MKRHLLLIAMLVPLGTQAQDGRTPALNIPAAPSRHEIPKDCLAVDATRDAKSQIPVALELGPDAASITKVEPTANLSRRIYYPAIRGQSELYELMCYVRVQWSNGRQEDGVFQEWEDKYGQVRVHFGSTPVRPG